MASNLFDKLCSACGSLKTTSGESLAMRLINCPDSLGAGSSAGRESSQRLQGLLEPLARWDTACAQGPAPTHPQHTQGSRQPSTHFRSVRLTTDRQFISNQRYKLEETAKCLNGRSVFLITSHDGDYLVIITVKFNSCPLLNWVGCVNLLIRPPHKIWNNKMLFVVDNRC